LKTTKTAKATASDISRAKELALSGKRLSRDLMIALLNIEENSPEFFQLGEAAREVSVAVTKNRAYLWGAIGMDFSPCAKSCDFCSLGEKWGIASAEDSYKMDSDEVIKRVSDYVNSGVRWIALRTNHFYNHEQLVNLVKDIRSQIPGDYELGLNIGDFDGLYADELYVAGANFAYHALRLREGVDTPFDRAERIATMSAINQSGLYLTHMVEPVGVEHTNEELADLYNIILDHNTRVSGVIARIPVAGTPLGVYPQISEARLAHIVAFTRLASAGIVEDIFALPSSQQAVSFGANVAVLDSGAIPRASNFVKEGWRGITRDDMVSLLHKGGYTTNEIKD